MDEMRDTRYSSIILAYCHTLRLDLENLDSLRSKRVYCGPPRLMKSGVQNACVLRGEITFHACFWVSGVGAGAAV